MKKEGKKTLYQILLLLVLVGIVAVIIVTGRLPRSEVQPPQEDAATIHQSSQELFMQEERTTVTLQTNEGAIRIELFDDLAPKTVGNFLTLSKDDFYDGVRFHRVIPGFMIQSGDPLSKDESARTIWGTGGPGYQFEDEIHTQNKNMTGTISMANAGPDTNGSQFFINVADNNFLDAKHTVFGRVVDGMDVVNTLAATPTLPNDQPIDDVVIEDIIVE
jgi:peptidylprolyl isomerase